MAEFRYYSPDMTLAENASVDLIIDPGTWVLRKNRLGAGLEGTWVKVSNHISPEELAKLDFYIDPKSRHLIKDRIGIGLPLGEVVPEGWSPEEGLHCLP